MLCCRWYEASRFGGGGGDFDLGYFLPLHLSAFADRMGRKQLQFASV